MIQIPLEIPQSLSEEETKDEFSLRNFQEIIVALVLGITSVIILIRLPFGFTLNLIIVVIYFVGLFELYRFFTFLNFYVTLFLSISIDFQANS